MYGRTRSSDQCTRTGTPRTRNNVKAPRRNMIAIGAAAMPPATASGKLARRRARGRRDALVADRRQHQLPERERLIAVVQVDARWVRLVVRDHHVEVLVAVD